MVKPLLNGNRITVFGLFSDHGIKACDLDGEKDQCIPCPPGWGQKNNVSSLNMEEAECYTTKYTENCAIGLFTKEWNFFITSTGKKCYTFKYEPRHDKTNKMSVRPAKTQISLGICPV